MMSPDIKAVRQNLALIVDNGQSNPALRENDTTLFGATLGNNVFVWRSGVGVDRQRRAHLRRRPRDVGAVASPAPCRPAGAVRAMEIDINTDWVSAFTYVPRTRQPVSTHRSSGSSCSTACRTAATSYLQPASATSSPSSPTPSWSRRSRHDHDHDANHDHAEPKK